MAHSYQTSTVSLTLPISCQICLGKVKQPVICANYHVFCSSCMQMWLTKASQCPSCRVSITPENPCREIIGGTNENYNNNDPSIKKCLRKTRGELLLHEYEDEIEGLMRENEELKAKHLNLESQLKCLTSGRMDAVQTQDQTVDCQLFGLELKEWTNKLQQASECCDKVQQDVDKLKEANKTLRSQSVDLIQENMRLKAEVTSRSPQKFGRYTVAALEAKIQQYEREVDHLKRALERSDLYIEDLESRLRKAEGRHLDVQDRHVNSKAEAEALTEQQKINMMMRSLSDIERGSIYSNPEEDYRGFSKTSNFVCIPTATRRDFSRNVAECIKKDNSECASPDLPTTPSSAFRSLTLRSPGIRDKKVAFKAGSYLRKLNFEDFPSPDKSNVEDQFSSLDPLPKVFPPNPDKGSSKSVVWGPWQSSVSEEPGPSTENPGEGATAHLRNEKNTKFEMSSEASMDAAYLDKISELDSMMLDGESCSSRGSQLSLASTPPSGLDSTLVPEPQACPDVLPSQLPTDNTDDPSVTEKAPESSINSYAALDLGSGSRSSSPGLTQSDEMSFDLLFDSLEENKADFASFCNQESHSVNPSASPSCSSSSSSNPVTAAKERLSIIQPTKRKSHSLCNVSSPTKLSKLM